MKAYTYNITTQLHQESSYNIPIVIYVIFILHNISITLTGLFHKCGFFSTNKYVHDRR